MGKRFVAMGPKSADGATVQLFQVILDQGDQARSEPFLDPMPLEEAERMLERLRGDGQFSSEVWEGPLP